MESVEYFKGSGDVFGSVSCLRAQSDIVQGILTNQLWRRHHTTVLLFLESNAFGRDGSMRKQVARCEEKSIQFLLFDCKYHIFVPAPIELQFDE